MSYSVTDILFSSQHYFKPFMHETVKHGHPISYSLSLSQKITAVALAVIIGIPSLVVGGIVTFYLVTAAMKTWNYAFHQVPKPTQSNSRSVPVDRAFVLSR